ncbi:MAG: nucleotidyltransferase domain-containing protein [Deltaproteobacteria bacterium]|nr:nucleotidyltransferase domain-containing protein [Deltaproteobacteria bacterium]
MKAGNNNASGLIPPLGKMLAEDDRVVAAYLFGSFARGSLRPDSDIDLALVYRDDEARSAVETDLLTMLGRLAVAAGRDVHVVDLERAGHVLRFQVFQGGAELFNKQPEKTKRLLEHTVIERFDWEYAMKVMDRAYAAQTLNGAGSGQGTDG